MAYSIYTPPAHNGVPNPFGPRLHNWAGGPFNEGSLFHGPIYVRPDFQLPWKPRPLRGVGEYETTAPVESSESAVLETFVEESAEPLEEPVEEESSNINNYLIYACLATAGVAVWMMSLEKS